jgi:hypothetical protein
MVSDPLDQYEPAIEFGEQLGSSQPAPSRQAPLPAACATPHPDSPLTEVERGLQALGPDLAAPTNRSVRFKRHGALGVPTTSLDHGSGRGGATSATRRTRACGSPVEPVSMSTGPSRAPVIA